MGHDGANWRQRENSVKQCAGGELVGTIAVAAITTAVARAYV